MFFQQLPHQKTISIVEKHTHDSASCAICNQMSI